MNVLRFLIPLLLLVSCKSETTKDVDFSKYFKGIDGTVVFYNPSKEEYRIYNAPLSEKPASPCSTFKIMSAYIALSEQIISLENSLIKWNGKDYANPVWNKNMEIQEAFETSCVWYFRDLINKVSPETVKAYLQTYHYGNQDISDWQGDQNTNTNIAELKGFWIESSLQISPLEQVRFLAEVFSSENQITQMLKEIMLVTDNPVKVYGKTGLGIKDDKVDTAWFVGFYEQQDKQKIFFAVRLTDKENAIADYRHLASFYAKQIALDIIKNIFSCAGETSKNERFFTGKWLEETTPNQRFVQGIELKPDGTAASIGMATLKYEKWTTDGSRLIVSGKSIGNGQTINFSDEWRVITINPQTMQIEQSNGYRINYYRVERAQDLQP